MKKIKNITDLENVKDKIRNKLPNAPFRDMYIDDTGCFTSNDQLYLTPEEALRVGKFLVEFYGPKPVKESE